MHCSIHVIQKRTSDIHRDHRGTPGDVIHSPSRTGCARKTLHGIRFIRGSRSIQILARKHTTSQYIVGHKANILQIEKGGNARWLDSHQASQKNPSNITQGCGILIEGRAHFKKPILFLEAGATHLGVLHLVFCGYPAIRIYGTSRNQPLCIVDCCAQVLSGRHLLTYHIPGEGLFLPSALTNAETHPTARGSFNDFMPYSILSCCVQGSLLNQITFIKLINSDIYPIPSNCRYIPP